jgi:NAD(P)-dependent dehydrogenase (short-subunit alcohol dehydrogenase family)
MDLENRVVIITGGGSGIGRAAALQFAEVGAKVLITGRRAELLEQTAEEHPNLAALVADVGRPEDNRRMVEEALRRWDRVDVLVNNAAAMAQQPLGEVQADTVTRIFATNVLGPTMLVQAALPHLERSRGAVINISSTYGHKAAPLISHYAASKAALEHLTRCWALELAARGIRVNSVAPGPTETEALASFGLSRSEVEEIQRREMEMIPLGRRGVAEEVARWIVRLASPEEDWITGQVVSVDGGLSLL